MVKNVETLRSNDFPIVNIYITMLDIKLLAITAHICNIKQFWHFHPLLIKQSYYTKILSERISENIAKKGRNAVYIHILLFHFVFIVSEAKIQHSSNKCFENGHF